MSFCVDGAAGLPARYTLNKTMAFFVMAVLAVVLLVVIAAVAASMTKVCYLSMLLMYLTAEA